MDALAKATGFTKAALYYHFKDKDQLIEETLGYFSALHRKSYEDAWNKKGLKPIQKLTVLFDEMNDFFKEKECYGCPYINTAGEFTNRESPARKICEEHYQFLIGNLEQFAREASLTNPRLVAEQIASVIAGSYCAWFVANIQDAAKQGKKIAEMIISSHQKR